MDKTYLLTSLGHWIAFCILSLCLLRLATDMGKPRWSRPASFRRQWRVSAIKVSSKTGRRWVFEHLKSCRYGDPFLARLRLVFIRWIQDVFCSLQVSYTMNFEFIVVEDIPLCSHFGTLMATPDQLGLWLQNPLKLSSHFIAVNSIFQDVLHSITWIWHPEIQAESLSLSLSLSRSFIRFSLFLLSFSLSFFHSFFFFLPLSLYIILRFQVFWSKQKSLIEELFHDPGSTEPKFQRNQAGICLWWKHLKFPLVCWHNFEAI